MDIDQQSVSRSSKRRRVDLPAAAAPNFQTTNPSSPTSTAAPLPSSLTPLPSRPAVLRGRPPLDRSAADVQAAATRFTCSLCGKVLQSASKLDRHQRTHSGDLPFACTTCGAHFSDQHNASRHQRTCTQRKMAEQAMQTTRLSWPIWREQPDEEGEEQGEAEEEGGVDMKDGEGREAREWEEAGAAELPRLNRWLFPQHGRKAADDAVT